MRATSNPPTPAQNADAVWDEIETTHNIPSSFGKTVKDIKGWVGTIHGDFARRTPYTYGPTNLAAGVTYVPAAGTVVTIAILDAVANDDFAIVHGTVVVITSGDGGADGNPLIKGYVGMLYCDGTNIGIKNEDAAGRDLSIEGFTI